MIIYLYGPDAYRRQEKVNWYLEEFRKKHSNLALEKFYLEQPEDWERFREFASSQTLFGGTQLGVVYNLREAEAKKTVPILKKAQEDKAITLIISEDKKLTKEFDFLLKSHTVAEFDWLSEPQAALFLKKLAQSRNLSLDLTSQNLLLQVYRNNSWGLVTELDKLALLEEKQLTREILEKHLDLTLPMNVFYALNEMRSSRYLSNRLSILERLLEQSDEPAMIFNILAASPYLSAAQKQKMADDDAAVKSGKLEYEEVLTNLTIGD